MCTARCCNNKVVSFSPSKLAVLTPQPIVHTAIPFFLHSFLSTQLGLHSSMEFPYDHQLLFNPNYYLQVVSTTTAEISYERLPQWTCDETRHLLSIRAQLDKNFSETKRNKPLWEAISSLLQQRGFHRTPDQCKSKWKNLVTRFKGSESAALEGESLISSSRQFPFYEEMRRIFSERMMRAQGVAMQGRKDYLEDEEEEQEDEEEVVVEGSAKKRKKVVETGKKVKNNKKKNSIRGDQDEQVQLEGALRQFMRKQLEMEARRVEAAKAREAERRETEVEWRRLMVELREKRVQMERWWREQEEERRAREEARSKRRHDLVVAILGKLIARSEE